MIDFPIEETIRKRSSIRTYQSKALKNEIKTQLLDITARTENPFNTKIKLQMICKTAGPENEKLGTYGVIKGAVDYVTAAVPNSQEALLALGYILEIFVLKAAHLGLGTCWLGGTFNRGSFAKAVHREENEIIPIVSPVGHPAEKQGISDRLIRTFAKSAKRNPFESMFFHKDFSTPLTKEEAGLYEFPLEMVRLAPSASNKQPWRIVKNGRQWDFYKKRSYGDKMGYDIEDVDLGIAVCHFHLALQDKGLQGRFIKKEIVNKREADLHYIITWESV